MDRYDDWRYSRAVLRALKPVSGFRLSPRFNLVFLVPLVALIANPARASDSCTIMYRLSAAMEVTDTDLGKGDLVAKDLEGSLLLEFSAEDGRVVDGNVHVLHFWTHEIVRLTSLVKISSDVHLFAPTCNGVAAPSWRRIEDPGFPAACGYGGNRRPVATGTLRRAESTIEWRKCKAAPSYWSNDRDAYTPDEKSKGRGCLSDLKGVGNTRCSGRIACKWGGLNSGDNPMFDVWTQPLVHGPPGAKGTLGVSSDLSSLATPTGPTGGHQSFNLPNDAPSRTWLSWKATRDDSSRFTTCR